MGCCRLLSGVLPPAPVRSFPFPGIAGCTPPAVFVCAWGSALPAAAALAFPRSPGAGPPSRPPVRPRARLPGFPGVRSGRLFQPLSRSNRPLDLPGPENGSPGFQGPPRGIRSGGFAPAAGEVCFWVFLRPRPSRGLPPLLAPRGPKGRFQLPGGSQMPKGRFQPPRGAGGLKARTGASWGRPGASGAGAPPGGQGLLLLRPSRGPPLALRGPQGRSQPRGGVGSVGKRSCGLKARTGASWGRPGPSPGRSLLPRRPGLSPEPFPPSLFF